MGVTIGGQIEIGGNILVSNAAIYTVVETFSTSGNLTVPANVNILSAVALLVGGGGGGGSRSSALSSVAAGGGGGAGGVIANVDVKAYLTPGTNVPVVIFGGGAIDSDGGPSWIGASPFVFPGLYAGAGARGGSGNFVSNGGSAFGSGGGASAATAGIRNPAGQAGGFGSSNNGSSNYNVFNGQHQAGSGGGAAGPGTQGSDLNPPDANAIRLGQGGPGIWDTISGQNVYYAEGGQGAYNQGVDILTGINGQASSSIGGGGGGGFQPGGATPGNAGQVVIRYTYTPRN